MYLGKEFDIIITTCDRARQSCPVFPGNAEEYHWDLEDPASVQGSEDERLAAFRKTFAEISERISVLLDAIRKMRG